MPYLNIHAHSVYSQRDAISEPIDIARINKEFGNDAFCITDHGHLGGWIEGYKAADKLDMQFIPGCEFYMIPDRPEFWTLNKKDDSIETVENTARYFHFIAIAKNQDGVKSLVTLYNTAKEHYGKPCISKENLFKYSSGLIVTNACASGEPLFYLRNGYDDLAEQWIVDMKKHFGDDFYVEIQYHNLTFMDEIGCYNKLVGFAKKHNVKIIPTTDSHFNKKEDVLYHNIYKDIFKEGYEYNFSEGKFDPAFNGDGYYIKNEDEIRESISNFPFLSKEDIDDMVSNTQEIRNKCEKTHFPKALPLVDKSEELQKLVEEGFKKKRLGTDLEQVSRDRIAFEMKTIKDMGFTEYFVNVRDILRRASMLNIIAGPARGSSAGSEVCYLIDIVAIDPIKNGLMFERFLNPFRFNYPDIDMDIQSQTNRPGYSGKDILIESLSKDRFPFSGQILNDIRASTLILFKQLARAFKLNFQEVNRITTDSEVAQTYIVEDEYTGWLPDQMAKLGISWNSSWEEFEKYIQFCYDCGGSAHGDKAKGVIYNSSVHASGVILYPYNDPNILPKNSQGITYRGHALEEMGFIKYDILGLNTLDPLAYFIPKILKDTGKTEFDWEDTFDKDTWDVFKKADTDFVFQFGSSGMKRALKIKQPDNIHVLAELNAVYRPGCISSGIFEAYLKDDWTEDQKVVGDFLKQEFGEQHSMAMIFQEDIMKVVQKMAGFSLADADLVRRAVQRKEYDRMESYKEQFINGFDKAKYGNIAETVWDTINAFASYAFNKSHSVAYGCIAYWTAYVFCHYKNELFEWLLNHNQDKQKVISYLSKDHKIVFPTLKTNVTSYKVTDKELIIPAVEISNQNTLQYLLSLTTDKKKMIVKYGVLDDFCVDRKGLRELFSAIPNKKIESLVDSYIDKIDYSSFDKMIKCLSALDVLDYEKNGGTYKISVKKQRSTAELTVYTTPNEEILFHNCQEDVRAFGIVRSKYVDDAPEVDVTQISERFESFKDDYDRDLRRTLKTIGDRDANLTKINNVNTTYRCVLTESKLTGYPKVKLAFSNNIIEAGVSKYSGCISKIKAMKKNTPVEVRFNVDLYIKDGEVSSSLKVVDISERKY